MKPDLRSYAMEDWFLALNPEQQYRYEERIGMLCEDGQVTDLAHDIAYAESKGFTNL